LQPVQRWPNGDKTHPGAFKNSHTKALELEAAVLPPELRFERICNNYSLRVTTFHGSHPIKEIVYGNTGTTPDEDLSQLQSFHKRLLFLLPEGTSNIEKNDPRWYPPWQATCPVRLVIPQRSKEAEKRIHLNRLKAVWKNPSIYVFYTDGSQEKRMDGTLQNSAAFCKLNSLGIDKASSMNLGTRVEIADAEGDCDLQRPGGG
jgi:hypothetical protein